MQQYQPNESIDLPKHVLLPGFVNAHTHVAMYLFKGYGDDNDLSDWLSISAFLCSLQIIIFGQWKQSLFPQILFQM